MSPITLAVQAHGFNQGSSTTNNLQVYEKPQSTRSSRTQRLYLRCSHVHKGLSLAEKSTVLSPETLHQCVCAPLPMPNTADELVGLKRFLLLIQLMQLQQSETDLSRLGWEPIVLLTDLD